MKHQRITVHFTYFIVFVATLWGTFVRFFHIDRLPPPAWYDEIRFALRAREFLQNLQWHAFYESSFGGTNAGPVYLTAIVQWLGIDAIYSARLVTAAFGTLTIPLAYVCFRELLHPARKGLGGEWRTRRQAVAVLTSVVLAYLLFYVIINRVGMEPGMGHVAVALFAVWQIRRAIRKRTIVGWALAGFVAGLAQYNGLHARFIPPLLAFFILHDWLRANHSERRHLLAGSAWLSVAGLLASLPLIVFFIQKPEWFLARASTVVGPMLQVTERSLFTSLLHNARLILLAFSVEGSFDPTNTVPGQPIFDWIQSLGFWVGVLWALWRFRSSTVARELLVWLGLMTLPSLLTEGAPNLQRMIGITPPAAALVALGWALTFDHLRTRINARLSAYPLLAASSALVFISIGWHTYSLFVRWPAVPILPEAFMAAPVTLANDLINRSESEPVFVSLHGEAEDVIAFEFLFPGTPVTRLDLRKCLPVPHQRPTRTNYLVLSDRDQETVDKLRTLYPSSDIPIVDLDVWLARATLVEVPGRVSAPPVSTTPTAQFDSKISLYGAEWSGATLKPDTTLFLTLYWYVAAALDSDLTSFAHVGTGLDAQPLIAQHDGQPCLGLYPTSRWQPGEVVPDSFAITLPPDAPPGDYELAVGWYEYPSLERLALISADNALPDNRAIIGAVHVVAQ